ncbi:MAG: alpha/beta hydrolase-fold protein, partial [Bryobacteraceae bacterium]
MRIPTLLPLLVSVLAAPFSLAFCADARFEISFSDTVRPTPVTGRVYIMISRTNQREPRLQVGRTGIPFFGRDVEKLMPGQTAIIDATDLGSPVASITDIPAGEYFVQAFVNVYSEFRRADGHVVWMHDDQWEGQQWNRSPGNLYSKPALMTVDGSKGFAIRIQCDQVVKPVEIPKDTEWVKRFKIQSPLLTKFWGRPVYLGATVLLPRDYATSTTSYPVLYQQGHYSLAAPLGFQVGEAGKALYAEWIKDEFPRMIAVTLQHPAPYFDDSYAVNSVNLGPYGDAILQELIPEIEKRFRVIRQPWARLLAGGSTGGWEALALQIFH